MTGSKPGSGARASRTAVLLVPALLFGFLSTVLWRTQLERTDLTAGYNAPLTDSARQLQDEQSSLKSQLADLRARLDGIQASAAAQSGTSNQLQQQIDGLKARAGLTAMTGEGVVVELDDARTGVPTVKEPDKSVCHATDVIDIVNTAWRAAAQAVAVNGERLVARSSAYCIGATVIVNGTLKSPPFNIIAIGPQNDLAGAFADPAQLRDIKQRREDGSLAFRVTRATALTAPAYDGASSVRFASPQ